MFIPQGRARLVALALVTLSVSSPFTTGSRGPFVPATIASLIVTLARIPGGRDFMWAVSGVQRAVRA